MSNEEIINAMTTASETDKKDLSEQLFNQNLPMIKRWIRQSKTDPELYEDALQECFITMLEAVKSFDKLRGANFLTYLQFFVYKALRNIRYTNKDRGLKSLDDMSGEDGDLKLEDLIIDPAAEEAFEDVDNEIFLDQTSGAIWNEVEKLPPKQSETIKAYHKDGRPAKEISEESGRQLREIYKDMQSGYITLKKKKVIREIAELYGIAHTRTWQTSYRSFLNSGSSATEKAALFLIQHGLDPDDLI